MTHAQYADSLRQVAEFIEAHPEIALPTENRLNVFPRVDCDEVKNHAARTAHALRHVKKEEFGDHIQLVADFGGFTYQVWYPRDQICERIEVGRKVVPAKPQETIIHEAVPEHEEVVYGWKCQPILGKPAVEVPREQPALTAGSVPLLEAEYVF